MSVSVTVNNVVYTIPETNETGWGSNVTSWIQAVSSSTLQKSGGTFTLSADVDFGASFGLKSLYYKSRATNPATAGQIRLGNTESIDWRNAANSGNLPLSVNGSDTLTYNGNQVFTIADVVPVANGGTGISSYTTGDLLYASGATTLSKLAAGTPGNVLVQGASVPAWGSAGATLAVTSKSADYTIQSTDDLILCDDSGASFTLTLPDCATNSGKVFFIKKNVAGFANHVTIARAGSDVIQDAGSTVISSTLNTQGEEIQIVSNGSTTWQIISRRIPSTTLTFTPTGSWSTAVAYTGTLSRIGDKALIRVHIAVSGIPDNTALTIDLPITIATANLPSTATDSSVGYGEITAAGNLYQSVVTYNTSTKVSVLAIAAGSANNHNTASVNRTNPNTFANLDFVSVQFIVPVSGWNG